MYVAIVAFDLKDSPVSFAELRAWVANRAADDYARLSGLRFKAWFSDERRRLWGAVYLVQHPDVLGPENVPRLPDGRTGPVGRRADSITWFELEAFVTDRPDMADVVGAGLSFDTVTPPDATHGVHVGADPCP
ncbi:MAG: hypothetical protein M3Q39_03700 [Actinomycetota bacterium]|nr:hypothetical protein [Actinomycetota bacterium]